MIKKTQGLIFESLDKFKQATASFRGGSIRTRLILAFVGTVLLTAIITSLSSIIIGFQNGQQQAIDELEAIADLKEVELDAWLTSIQDDLVNLATEEAALLRMRSVLQPTAYRDLISHELRGNFEETLKLTQKFDELLLIGLEGEVIVSTDSSQEGSITNQPFVQGGLEGPFIQPPRFDPSINQVSMFASYPILHRNGEEVLGMVVGRVNLDQLDEIILQEQSFSSSSQTYVVDANNTLITGISSSAETSEPVAVQSEAARKAIEDQANGSGSYDNHLGTPVIGVYRWLPRLNAALLTEESQTEAFQATFQALSINIIVTIGAVGAAILILLLTIRRPLEQIDNVNNVFEQISRGNYAIRADVLTTDELGQMASTLNVLLDDLLDLVQTQEERTKIAYSIQTLLNEVSGVAKGDLTTEAVVAEDITGPIAASFNVMIRQLRQIIGQVQEATLQVSNSAHQIQTTAVSLSQGSEMQATQIVDTSTAVEEMSVSIRQVSENANLSADVAERALQNSRQGAHAVQDTIQGMNRIHEQVQEMAKRIEHLGENSQKIGDSIELIKKIANRTSVLALNASIQAAKAGPAGKGFAEVAREVENLAEQATEATRQIAGIVEVIQNETSETVSAIQESQREVIDGSNLANQAGQSLMEIENVSRELADLIQFISMTSQQQARGSEAMASSMSAIAEVTQQTAAGTQQAAVSISNLAALADNLRNSVSTFKLPSDNGHVNGSNQ